MFTLALTTHIRAFTPDAVAVAETPDAVAVAGVAIAADPKFPYKMRGWTRGGVARALRMSRRSLNTRMITIVINAGPHGAQDPCFHGSKRTKDKATQIGRPLNLA